jgi:hypothetical protein
MAKKLDNNIPVIDSTKRIISFSPECWTPDPSKVNASYRPCGYCAARVQDELPGGGLSISNDNSGCSATVTYCHQGCGVCYCHEGCRTLAWNREHCLLCVGSCENEEHPLMRFKLLALQDDYPTVWISAVILVRFVLMDWSASTTPSRVSENNTINNNDTIDGPLARITMANDSLLQHWLSGYKEDHNNDHEGIDTIITTSFESITEIFCCHFREDTHSMPSPMISLLLWNELFNVVRRNVYASSIESPLATEYASTETSSERKQELFDMSGASHELELLDCPDSFFLSMSYYGLPSSMSLCRHSCIPSHHLLSQLVLVDNRDSHQDHHPTYTSQVSLTVTMTMAPLIVTAMLTSLNINNDNSIYTISMIGDLVLEDFETRQKELSRRGMESCRCLRCQFEQQQLECNIVSPCIGQEGLELLLEYAKEQERYVDALDVADAMVTMVYSSIEKQQQQGSGDDSSDGCTEEHIDIASALPEALFRRARIAGWNGDFCQRLEWLKQAILQRPEYDGCENNQYWEEIVDAITEAHSYSREVMPEQREPILVAAINTNDWITVDDLDGMAFYQEAVLNAKECAEMILLVERHQQKHWTTSRHYAVPTTDIPVYKIPALLEWFNLQLEGLIYPMVRKQFLEASPDNSQNGHHHSENPPFSTLRIMDAFLVKYDFELGQRRLPLHNDQSDYSLTIAMNPMDEYGDGGTFFSDSGETVKTDVGGIISFEGQLSHAGMSITRGTRYIIVCFICVEEESHQDHDGN